MRLPVRQTLRLPVTVALVAVLTLSACGGLRESRLNPLNWFGRSRDVAQTAVVSQAPQDPRNLIQTVLSMSVEPFPGGAIIRATGLPPTQGWWEAELVARPVDDKGVLVLDFRVFAPPGARPVVNQQSREITAAISLSNIKLEGIREIVVQGETNARSSRR